MATPRSPAGSNRRGGRGPLGRLGQHGLRRRGLRRGLEVHQLPDQDAAGPTYFPLTDNVSAFGMNISSIASSPATTTPRSRSSSPPPATATPWVTRRWTGYDRAEPHQPRDRLPAVHRRRRDLDAAGQHQQHPGRAGRDHFFASIPGQMGVHHLVQDRRGPDADPLGPGDRLRGALGHRRQRPGRRAGQPGHPKGGIWRSLDSGQTWTQMRPVRPPTSCSTRPARTPPPTTSTSSTPRSGGRGCTAAPTAARPSVQPHGRHHRRPADPGHRFPRSRSRCRSSRPRRGPAVAQRQPSAGSCCPSRR